MSTRKERRERSRLHGVCRNCGEKGRHFAPPGFGSPGMYICKPKTEEASVSDETDTTSQVARVLLDHDAERMECMDHDRLCCPTCDAHDFASAYKHQADALAEAGLLRDHATIDALNQRCQILVGEADGLRAQIATQEPAGATLGGSDDSRASGGLGERLRALVPAIYADDGYFGVTALEIRGLADEADRMERDREGLRLRAELAESGLAMAARQKRAEREGS